MLQKSSLFFIHDFACSLEASCEDARASQLNRTPNTSPGDGGEYAAANEDGGSGNFGGAGAGHVRAGTGLGRLSLSRRECDADAGIRLRQRISRWREARTPRRPRE